ncbi:MAG: ABC transporter permease [Treponema sp.]|jgi:ribose/xylose/arabinose/galactoside ABC-type transport system permease subunit|nr:ABC transporter permease [Treponema sp.]
MKKANIMEGKADFFLKNPACGFFVKNKAVFLLLGIVILAAFSSEKFTRPINVTNVLQQVAPNGIVAVGLTMVVITGGFDMSVGSVMALTGVITMMALKGGSALITAVCLGLLTGLGTGFLNGIFIGVVGITPFIATLGTMTLVRGIAHGITEAHPVTMNHKVFARFAMDNLGLVPWSFIVFILLAIGAAFFLRRTRIGHQIYIYGSNREAGYAAGLNMTATLILTYTLCGLLASVAGIFLASKVGAGSPVISEDACLLGMTAIIIGGNKLSGSRATMTCTVIGVLTLGVLNNIMNLTRMMAYFQTIIKGLLVVTAMAIDAPGVNKYLGLARNVLQGRAQKK